MLIVNESKAPKSIYINYINITIYITDILLGITTLNIFMSLQSPFFNVLRDLSVYTWGGGAFSFKSLKQSVCGKRSRCYFQPQGGSKGQHCGETPPLCSILRPAACEDVASEVADPSIRFSKPVQITYTNLPDSQGRTLLDGELTGGIGSHGGDGRPLPTNTTRQSDSVREAETREFMK